MTYHGLVWLDHRLAKIIAFNMHGDDRKVETVHSHGEPHIHHKAGTMGSGHAHDDPGYFQDIAGKLHAFQEVLILGPAETKTALATHLRREFPEVALHVAGVEPMSHETDGEIVEFARAFFRRIDKSTPQR